MTITLKFNLPDDFFGAILDTTLDTCPEWLQVGKYTLSDLGKYPVSVELRPHWEEGKPFWDWDVRNYWQLVDHAKIEAAIQKIIDRNIPLNSLWYAVKEGDACHIDADAADAILQIAMFDEIVFG